MVSVSVVIPVYNGEKYLEKCLSSILTQLFKDYEVVVVNDGSTDNTEMILAEYGSQIKVLNRSKQGLSKSLNQAIENSHGCYIAYVSHDDWWMPCKLALEYNFIKNSKAGVVYSDYIRADDAGNGIRVSPHGFSGEKLLKECYINISSSLISKKYLDKIRELDGYYFDESLESAMDWDLLIRLSSFCKFKHLPKCLSYYRIHAGQFSRKHRKLHLKDGWKIYTRYNSFAVRKFLKSYILPTAKNILIGDRQISEKLFQLYEGVMR